jgi:hypothetical protein
LCGGIWRRWKIDFNVFTLIEEPRVLCGTIGQEPNAAKMRDARQDFAKRIPYPINTADGVGALTPVTPTAAGHRAGRIENQHGVLGTGRTVRILWEASKGLAHSCEREDYGR